MFKFLKGVVGGSGTGIKDLPYNVGEPYSSAWGSWTHSRGTSKDDGSPVSVFSISGSSPQDGHLIAARNGVKRLRTVRHPNILAFLHSTETESFDGSSTRHTIYMVTEPVMPLSEKVKELGLQGVQRDEYYAWGLNQVAKAVSFLNNDCKLVHGNVCLTSVVVTATLDWKLHAFDVLSEFDGGNPIANGPILQYEWLVASQYKSTEFAKSDWSAIRKSPTWSIDSWGFGCLIYELFSGGKLAKTEDLRNTGSIPKSLLQDYQRLLSSMPSRRLNTSKLLENSEYFQNKLVDTIHFMDILTLKDSIEKDTFFRKLPTLAEQLPRQIVLKKILPSLASSLEFGTASSLALAALLKLGSWLPAEEFNAKILPTIIKLFASNDRAIRVSLLQHIDQFGESLSSTVVDEQIYTHVASGFSDTSAFLRELTLKSMLVLAPKLSQRTISGSLLKYLSKLQVDEEPAIRTNTTILLGNIASHLNDGTRKRVLINAFTARALRDAFAPARGAGLMALCATSSYYDVTETATRILPNVIVLTIDPDIDVRSKAFQAVDQFLLLVKQSNDKTNSGDVTSSVGVSSSTQGNSGLLGWAMSSLTSKTKPNETSQIVSENPTASVPPESHGITALDGGGAQIEPTTSYQDGWGEIDDDDLQLSPLANIQAAQKRPVAASGSAVGPKAAAKDEMWGEVSNSEIADDEPWDAVAVPAPTTTTTRGKALSAPKDDDPWAAIAAPAPKTKARPLSAGDSDDPWASIAAPAPATKVKPLSVAGNDDPWAAIAAPPPTTKVKPLSAGRGRGVKPKLGAQKINRASSTPGI